MQLLKMHHKSGFLACPLIGHIAPLNQANFKGGLGWRNGAYCLGYKAVYMRSAQERNSFALESGVSAGRSHDGIRM